MSFFSVYCAIRPRDGIFSGRYSGLVLELLCAVQRGQKTALVLNRDLSVRAAAVQYWPVRAMVNKFC
jgi:hypothetical protein